MSILYLLFPDIYSKVFDYSDDCPLLEFRYKRQVKSLCEETGIDETHASLALRCITCSYVDSDGNNGWTPEKLGMLRDYVKCQMRRVLSETGEMETFQCEECDYREPRAAMLILPLPDTGTPERPSP